MVLCSVCQRQVYSTEELQYQGKIYHKTCFKCTSCAVTLNLKNACSYDKLPYCGRHSPQSNRTLTSTPTNEPVNTLERQPNNTVVDKCSISLVRDQPSQSSTIPSTHPKLTDRASVLATGYDTVQSQIELAGQVFTADPMVRQKIFNTFDEFNIIVCGSARVGKSTLINAICGRPLAKTDPGLDSCTKEISHYVLEGKCRVDNEWKSYRYNFWDTPGFESWNETDIRTNFDKIIKMPKSDPLCMIYCASPGSFANTEQLKWLLDVCIREHKLLCALVVTNKWGGQKKQRIAVLDTFKKLLANYHQQTNDEDEITYFGNVALCTMVNAQPYIDEDQDINHGEEGVDELIQGIMTCLDDDSKVFHWCMVVIQKKGFVDTLKGRMKQGYDNIKNVFKRPFVKKKN